MLLQSTTGATLPSRHVIGVFDSGLGGLSVVREILRLAPGSSILYFGDRAWAPYGERSLADVRARSERVTDHLLAAGADTMVIACNTASAAALNHLRARHAGVPFVGMEPAVKPAAAVTRSGTIGVLATPATFQGELYASVVDRFATGLEVLDAPCPGWMEMVESPPPEDIVAATIRRSIEPLLERGADVLVLGCTHYPFLRHHIERIAGSGVAIIDPGEAVARQVIRIGARRPGPFGIHVSGPADGVAARVRDLTGLAPPIHAVTLRDSVS